MSDHFRLPLDDDALDRYWDALVNGQEPSAQLPPDVAQALRRFSSLDPAPQSSSVRERAWAETWKRMQSTPPEQELSSMHALSISSNHRVPQPIPVSGHVRSSPSRRIDRRLAAVATLIAASLLAFVAYGFFGPFASDPENGPIIPAAVMQEATPMATPAGEHKITIDLPASMVHSTKTISAGWDYIEFPGNSTFEYVPYCCPGPFIEYVLSGQLTVQSDAPMTIFRADGTSESIPIGQETTLLAGDAFLAENEARLVATNNGRELTQLLGWVLVNENLFSGHAMGGFAPTLTVDLEVGMKVTAGPGQVIITRYDTLEQIPEPAPNSYQFILQSMQGPDGTPTVSTALTEIQGTLVTGEGSDGFYVLDFLMSPPGPASPEATPEA